MKQKNAAEVEREIKRELYLNKLVSKKHNGLIKVVTGIRRKYIGTPMKYYYTDMELRNARINFRQLEDTHTMENDQKAAGSGFYIQSALALPTKEKMEQEQRTLMKIEYVIFYLFFFRKVRYT